MLKANSNSQEPSAANCPFRVLVMDGGGMRGLYAATVLKSLLALCGEPEEKRKAICETDVEKLIARSPAINLDFGRRFDLLAGTSTGGLLAATLAYGCTLEQIIGIYESSGPKIFPHPMPDQPSRTINSLAMSSWALRFRDKCPGNPAVLREKLVEFLGTATLRDLWSKKGVALCIPVTNVNGHSSLVFKTPHHAQRDAGDTENMGTRRSADADGYDAKSADYSLVDVCMATAAAPVLFPLALVPDPADPENPTRLTACTDGGLWANSPVLISLIEAMKLHKGRPIEMVVLGSTGLASDQGISPDEADWGLIDWSMNGRLLELALEVQSQGHYQTALALLPFLKVEPKPMILRLPYSFPTPEEAPLFGMDKSKPKALAAMRRLALSDALRIYDKIRNNEDGFGMLKAMFAAENS